VHISINYFSDYDKYIFVRVVALVAPLHGQWVRGSVADSGRLLMCSSAWLILLSWNGSDLQPAMHRPHDNPSIEQFATRQYIIARNTWAYYTDLAESHRSTSQAVLRCRRKTMTDEFLWTFYWLRSSARIPIDRLQRFIVLFAVYTV